MKLRDIMTRNIQIVSIDQTLQEAAEIMREADVGMLPVYDDNTIVGVLTDRDIVVNAVARGLSPVNSTVAEGMSKNVFFCFDDDSVETAAQLMKERGVRRIVVTDRKKHPIGILSLTDLAARLDNRLSHDVLKTLSTPI